MSYAPNIGENFIRRPPPAPRCPRDPTVVLLRVGSLYASWRCPQCGAQYQPLAASYRWGFNPETGEQTFTPDPCSPDDVVAPNQCWEFIPRESLQR